MELQIDGTFFEVIDMNAKLATRGKWGAKDALVSLSKADTLASCSDTADYRGVVSVVSHSSGKYRVRFRLKGQAEAGFVGISRQVPNNPNYWTVDSFNPYQLGGAADSVGLGNDGNGSFNSGPLYGMPAGVEQSQCFDFDLGHGWIVGSAGDPEAGTGWDFEFYPGVPYFIAADLSSGASAEFWPDPDGSFAGW